MHHLRANGSRHKVGHQGWKGAYNMQPSTLATCSGRNSWPCAI